MKILTILATGAILLSACGGTSQTNATANPPALSGRTPYVMISPVPDDIGLVLECNKCVFIEEQGNQYLAGEIHSNAKQAIGSYVLAVDLQDAKGTSIKKIPGVMLMEAMTLQPGETKEFKERVLTATNVTQATVYFKKAGKDVRLSNTLTLKLNAPAATPTPAKVKGTVRPKP